MTLLSHVLTGAVVACTLTACSAESVPPEKNKQPLATPATASGPVLPATGAAHLDSGNVAFRAKAYDDALRHYRAAADAAPDHAAPWYGVFMVGEATKNKALADSATAMVAQRSGGGGLSDTAMAKAHSGTGAMPGALPPDHPPTNALPPGHPTPGKAAPGAKGTSDMQQD
ncbi:MAG: hypothetical protein MUF00_12840 [Gemmatimonadaceae bacterium]|jgi:hypothetical protein|nr:hypothetical protein [Gemmatimonadaceae bacterium]